MSGRICSICLTFDVDAFSLWVTSFSSVSPSVISRGEFGTTRGVPRILDLLDKTGIAATFFIPATVANHYKELTRRIHSAGHEIGVHGFQHERIVGLSWDEEFDIARRSLEALESITGRRPVGYRAPGWELTENSVAILEDLGVTYDSSQMADDYHPYRCRRHDSVTDGMFVPGTESSLWEIPVAWELDDFPYFLFNPRPYFAGRCSPAEVLDLWVSEFHSAMTTGPGAVFTLTMHPELIGRLPRIQMLERLITIIRDQPGTQFSTLEGVIEDLTARKDHDANTEEESNV
jgi:peptidoglycan-N-acetylglucosamine deacetylase